MTKRKGASGIRSGLSAALDSDVITPAEPQTAPPPPRKGRARKASAPVEPSGLRGTERAAAGDPIEKVTITMPASLVRDLDAIVFERKRTTRAYNRSALIQEAIAAFLQNHGPETDKS